MLIRKMLESDVVQVHQIEKEIFSQPWSEEDFYSSLKNTNNLYLVAEIHGEIVGYCGCWGIAGEGDIYNVAVKTQFRRKRIGLEMLQELIREGQTKGLGTFTLEVRRSNLAAIRLYETLGFEQVAIRKDFYQKPNEDAVIMWWKPIQ